VLRHSKGRCIVLHEIMGRAQNEKMGTALRKRRKILGLTLQEVAARAGTTQGAVSHIERGIRQPSAEMLARLAKALDCSVDQVLAGVVGEGQQGRYIPRVVNAMKAFSPPMQKQVADYCDFLRQQARRQSRKSH
jgi:transcriptional regulator with XRE-family HTH domain